MIGELAELGAAEASRRRNPREHPEMNAACGIALFTSASYDILMNAFIIIPGRNVRSLRTYLHGVVV